MVNLPRIAQLVGFGFVHGELSSTVRVEEFAALDGFDIILRALLTGSLPCSKPCSDQRLRFLRSTATDGTQNCYREGQRVISVLTGR
jgi:hypothetical protein